MSRPFCKSELPEGSRRLVELMQQLNFGRIENLSVRDGQPLLEPPPRVVREIKIGGDNGPRPEALRDDFPLKAQHSELFACLADLGEGTVVLLEVKHGLPFRLLVS
jgi:hypothetical protein